MTENTQGSKGKTNERYGWVSVRTISAINNRKSNVSWLQQ
jgi:hypothetical protein